MTDPTAPGASESAPSGSQATPETRQHVLRKALVAIAIGTAGGFLFAFLKLPLPWMMGAMVATTICSIAGLNIGLPQPVRMVMIAILGVMLGSAFKPELLDHLGKWAVSVTGLFFYGIVALVLVLLFLRKVAKYDPVTAYFSSSPGGLNEMVIVGKAMGGDDRIIALTHASRILIVVMIIPFLFRIFGGYEPQSGMLPPGNGFDIPAHEWALMAGCAIVGPLVARRLKLPAAPLLGAMVLSLVVHLTGWSKSAPPSMLIAAAQVVIGTGVGCRFAGTRVSEVLKIIQTSFGASLILLSTAVAAGFLLQDLVGLPWYVLVLAYAPGGLAEMSMVALGIGQDVAFVATHHLFRIAFIVVLAPLAFRLIRKAWTA
ncbi:AbrB family transcriptional regulator [Nisaea acidiphila]|uniref:AbrB family transcriptional regulator n=1 Tax=Nisaea acidiphila TaxID=1862145 RepID=A0A9J7AWA2_9PROT|nr:AbrB family transcriptional regulator [Nisaea acidiphila]UUX50548.1 AbrB family transcriptional regulator [Nisaea acidiphila]